MARPYNKRISETNVNIQGLLMKIIAYESSTDICVQFEDGYVSKNRTCQEFRNGTIMNKNVGSKLIKIIDQEKKN